MNTSHYRKFIPSTLLSALLLLGSSSHIFYNSSLHALFETIPTAVAHIRNLPDQPVCKILVDENSSSFRVEIQSSHNIYDPYTGKKVESAFSASSYTMIPTPDGIKWGQEFPGIYQLLLVPDSKTDSIVVNGISYPGVLAFYQIGSQLSMVNWVSLEDFTRSLLSNEALFAENSSKEVLAAYAVLYRSLSYQALIRGQNNFWDMKGVDIGYKGNSSNRVDQPFLDALKNSEGIVFDVAKSIPEAQKEPLNQLLIKGKEKLPYAEMQNGAENKKDAKQILEKYFPKCTISLFEPIK